MRGPRWLGILSRCIAAVLGGYLLAALVAIGCALWLGPPRAEAVLVGMLLSFAVHAGAVIWVFAARSAGGPGLASRCRPWRWARRWP
ncbi:DUF3649 domain-containing protein [Paeniroseomonas aquatica]|uniref:DUF3649 domain-containing protein n=1 Tax=Paeniroseomonas aquatica TaxID=373043 RepID=UPI00360D2116